MRYISAKMKATEGRGSIVQNDYILFRRGLPTVAKRIEDILNGWSLIILGFAVVVPPKSFRSMFLVCGLGNLCWI